MPVTIATKGSSGTEAARALVVLAAVAVALPVRADYPFSHPGCADVDDTQFRRVDLVTRARDQVAEPLKMALDLTAAPGEDAKDKVDVYFVERYGNVRKFDSRTNTVITLAKIATPAAGTGSDGVTGIALDPGFKANRRLYLFYTFSGATEASYRVSRFELSTDRSRLDPASEKVILRIPIRLGQVHTGGAMAFDAYGDLWITVGDAGPEPTGPANSNALRGKILRIHPMEDGSYSIPKGNLFPEGLPNTRPEIYIMGSRNPYTLTLDPVRRWLGWGDVGPDGYKNPDGTGALTEEKNFVTAPGNHGWPFFSGGNFPIVAGINPGKPVIPANTNWSSSPRGLDTLPPAQPATWAYRQASAITGPFYRYDGDLNSSVKLPPHFDRKWFVTEFGGGSPIVAVTLGVDGSGLLDQDTLMKSIRLNAPLDFQAGPDGALYIINYAGYRTVTAGTGIIRIEYTGTCRPSVPKLETPVSARVFRAETGPAGGRSLRLPGRNLSVTFLGAHGLEIRDLRGRILPTTILRRVP